MNNRASSHSDAEGGTQAALSAPHLVSVPPEPLVRQTGQTRETLQQLVRKKHLPRSFILCTETQTEQTTGSGRAPDIRQ